MYALYLETVQFGVKKDIHEADLEHLKEAAEAYRYVAEKEGWKVIDCTKEGKLLSIPEIHQLVYHTVKPLLKES